MSPLNLAGEIWRIALVRLALAAFAHYRPSRQPDINVVRVLLCLLYFELVNFVRSFSEHVVGERSQRLFAMWNEDVFVGTPNLDAISSSESLGHATG